MSNSISIERKNLNEAIKQFVSLYQLGVTAIPGTYGDYVNAKAWFNFIRNTALEIRLACVDDLAKLDAVFARYRRAIYQYHEEDHDVNVDNRYSYTQTRARTVEERNADLFDWYFRRNGNPSNYDSNKELALSYFRLLGVEANKLSAIAAAAESVQPDPRRLAATVEG